jgi:hypothetical protein
MLNLEVMSWRGGMYQSGYQAWLSVNCAGDLDEGVAFCCTLECENLLGPFLAQSKSSKNNEKAHKLI